MIRTINVLKQSSPWVGLALSAALSCSVESKDDFRFDDTPEEAGAGGSGATGGRGGTGGKGGSSGGKAGSTTGGKGGSAGKGGTAGTTGGDGGTNGGGEGGMVEGGMGGSSASGGTAGTGSDPCDPNPCVNGSCNADGSDYTCDCLDGYTGNRCQTNIDDCAGMPCLNDGMCLDRVAGFECDCSGTGYTGDTCETQIQNCAQSPCDNGGQCTDVDASRVCDCTGTGATGDSCEVDIDECATTPCVHGTCSNGRNQYTCECAGTGYTGPDCQTDIDECMSNNGGCDSLTMCINRDGSFGCGNCPTGYSGNGMSGCTEINECSNGTHDCDNSPAATCVNTTGAFDCICPANGFTGDGHGSGGCADINECSNGTHDCDTSPVATCSNTTGSFDCACPSGYSGSGHGSGGCVNINDCNPNPCQNGGTCTDGVNTFSCTCQAPWSGGTCTNATLSIIAADQGFYLADGTSDPTNQFAFAGYTTGGLHRAYIVWAIPNFTGTVSAVNIRGLHNFYNSPDASESGSFRDVTPSNISTMVAGGTSTAIYTDLGAGTQYGTFTLTASTLNTLLTYPISAAASAVYAARGSSFAVGILESSYGGSTGIEGFRCCGSSTAQTELLISVQ